MGWLALNLLECVLTLYPQNADGTANLDAPIWSGIPAQNLRVADRWIKIETKPTGAPYPIKHPLVPQFEISIERVWALYVENLDGVVPDQSTCVLDIVWTEELSGQWHRETFYGVTISDRNRASRNEEQGFTEGLTFDAQYYVLDSGQGSAPSIAGTLPMQVVYVDGGTSIPIYNYNPDNQAFTETQSGLASSLASLAAGNGRPFEIVFATEQYPVLWLDESGTVWTFNLTSGAPLASATPRLDFYIGPTRVASLDASGTLYSNQFLGNPQLAQSNAFQFLSSNAVQLTLDATAARANNWHLFNPMDVSGDGTCELVCWARVENLGAMEDGQAITSWPDESGNGNDLDCASTYSSSISYQSNVPYCNSPPALSENPDTDLATQETLPESGSPAVLVESGETLTTLGASFNPDAHALLVVACPFGFNATGALLNSNPTGLANDFSLALAAGKIQGNFWTQTSPDTVTQETATGNSVLTPGWYLFEQTGDANSLTVTVNGTVAASVAFTSTSTGTFRPIQLGAVTNGFAGYVKAVLVYQGNPTDAENFWLRLFLNNAYQIFED